MSGTSNSYLLFHQSISLCLDGVYLDYNNVFKQQWFRLIIRNVSVYILLGKYNCTIISR